MAPATTKDTCRTKVTIEGTTFNTGGGNVNIIVDGGEGEGFNLAEWFSDQNNDDIHKRIYEKVIEGTGTWIFEEPKLKEWLERKMNLLWVTGMPGAGKSCLASIVIEHLLDQDDATVLFIHCQYDTPLSVDQVLASLLKQLVQDESIAKYVSTIQSIQTCIKKKTTPSKSDLLAAFRAALHNFKGLNVFIVVDGLDELRTDVWSELPNALISFQCPLFITSRELRNVPGLNEPDFSVQAPESDLRTFITSRISTIPDLQPFLDDEAGSNEESGNIEAEIIQKVLEKSQGMFLLADLQVKVLASGAVDSLSSVRKALEMLPTDLDNMFQLTIERIRSQHPKRRDLALRAVMILAHTVSALTEQELLSALKVNIEEPEKMDDDYVPLKTLLSACIGLLSLEGGNVKLIHYSAQEFFQKWKEEPFGDPDALIVKISAIYIKHSQDTFSSIKTKSDLQNTRPSHPFFVYACENLGFHATKASKVSDGAVPEQLVWMFNECHRIPIPLPILRDGIDHGGLYHFAALHGLVSLLLPKNIPQDSPTIISALGCSVLFYSCLGGHTEIAEMVLMSKHESLINHDTTSFGATLLHAAAFGGTAPILELLAIPEERDFEKFPTLPFNPGEFDTNARMTDGQTALHLAARRGHVSTVTALLRCDDLEVNIADNQGASPLQFAAEGGHQGVVRRLLAHPTVDVNFQEEPGVAPLFASVIHEQTEIVKILLKAPEINANVIDSFDEGTPLHWAVDVTPHAAIVQALAECPTIQPNIQNMYGKTALHVVAGDINDNTAIIKVLFGIDGIDVNVQDEDGRTPLHHAIEMSHEANVKALLTNPDFDVNIEDNQGLTPLQIAVDTGDYKMMMLLLQYTFDHDALDEIISGNDVSDPLLMEALVNGEKEFISFLLKSGKINVNIRREKDGYTPLHCAVEMGGCYMRLFEEGKDTITEMVRLLLSSPDIDVNAKDDAGFTPLHRAVEVCLVSDCDKPVLLLLNHPLIDIGNEGPEVQSPLEMAVLSKNKRIVEWMLQSQHIDVNRRNADGFTPLQLAIFASAWEVVALLLSCPRISVDVVDNNGSTALHTAVFKSAWEILPHLLTTSGIDVNIKREKDGKTPLHLAIAQDCEVEIIKRFLTAPNTDFNATDNDGCTPLHEAISRGNRDVVELLIGVAQINLDAKMTSPEGERTPLQLAEDKGNHEIIALLNPTKPQDATLALEASTVAPKPDQRGIFGPLWNAVKILYLSCFSCFT